MVGSLMLVNIKQKLPANAFGFKHRIRKLMHRLAVQPHTHGSLLLLGVLRRPQLQAMQPQQCFQPPPSSSFTASMEGYALLAWLAALGFLL